MLAFCKERCRFIVSHSSVKFKVWFEPRVRNVSIESEEVKDVREKFRDAHPNVDGLGRLRAHLRGLEVDLRVTCGSKSSPFSVKNSSCLGE